MRFTLTRRLTFLTAEESDYIELLNDSETALATATAIQTAALATPTPSTPQEVQQCELQPSSVQLFGGSDAQPGILPEHVEEVYTEGAIALILDEPLANVLQLPSTSEINVNVGADCNITFPSHSPPPLLPPAPSTPPHSSPSGTTFDFCPK